MRIPFMPGSTGVVRSNGAASGNMDLPITNRLPVAGGKSIAVFLQVPQGFPSGPSAGELIYRYWTGPNYGAAGSWTATGEIVQGTGPTELYAVETITPGANDMYIELGIRLNVDADSYYRVDILNAVLITD